jgi:hypothetical protein
MTLYWLAGILEGEGSFLAGPPSEPNCPAIRLPMTDRDVVVRVAELFHRAVVATDPRQNHHKVPYVTTIKGAPAARMMRALAPLMSPLRRSQIEKALGAHHPTRRLGLVAEKLATDGSELSWEAADAQARIAWLAGVLEGEGSFLSARFDRYCYPQVQMTMCDRSVLERAVSLMPSSHIYAVIDKRGVERGWSESWMVRVTGPAAATVMRAVLQWMGSRRTEAINRSLSAWRPIRVAPPRSSCIVPGCARRHAARGLCNTHYMSWSRDRAKGRVPRITPLR